MENKTIQIKIYILLTKDLIIELDDQKLYNTSVKEVFFNEQDAIDSMVAYTNRSLFLNTEYEIDTETIDIPSELLMNKMEKALNE
jgi:hypothetical protein